MSRRHTFLIVILVYLVSTFVFTYPLPFKAHNHIYNGIGDPVSIHNVFFWNNYNIFHGEKDVFKLRQFYPSSEESLAHDTILGNQFIFAPVYALTKNSILATNSVVFFSFFLSAISMFLLAYYWTNNIFISFISGFIFGFSPLRLGNSQIQFMNIYWIPVFFIFFDKFLRHKKLKDIIVASVLYSIQALYSWYIAFMFTLCILCYLFVYIIINRKHFQIKEYLLKASSGLLIIFVLVGPFAYHYYKISKTHSFKHPLGTAVQYSASFIDDYFLSRDRNLVFGKLRYQRPIIKSLPFEKVLFNKLVNMMGDKASYFGTERLPGKTIQEKLTFERFSSIVNRESNEKNLYIGIIPILLAVLGFIYSRRQFNRKIGEMTNIFFWIGLFFFVLSFGPFLIVLGHFTYIPLPYLILYYVFPAFNIMRVPARMGYIVMFSLSIMCTAGLLFIVEKFREKKILNYIFISLIAVFMVESLTVPVPMWSIKVGDEIPEVYKWLRNEYVKGGVAEVPSIKGNLSKYDPKYGELRGKFNNREIEYIYYGTYHLKPIINGTATFFPDSYFQITRSLNDISNPESVALLKKYDVNLFIVHGEKFDEEDKIIWTDENIEKAGLVRVVEFGNDVVYKWE